MSVRSCFSSKRILVRIVLPFTFLFSVTAVSFWLFSTYLVGRYLDEDLRQQMSRVAKVISQSSYVLNPAILRQMKDVIHAEIALFDEQGLLLHSTFSESMNDAFGRETIWAILGADRKEEKTVEFQAQRYNTVIQPLIVAGHGSAFLSLWMPSDETDRLQKRIFQATGWLAFLGALAMTLLGYLVARTITLPVEELAEVTGRIAGGDFKQRAVVRHDDEIGALARSFNLMIEQVKAYEQMLVESEKMSTAGQMAAGLAHEIRNPLTSIKMFVQLLHGRLQNQPENQAMADSLLQEICRLERIVEQIVERARPGELRKIRANINDHLREVTTLAEPTMEAASIRLESDLDASLPLLFYDPEKMKQVFWNLLLNSREAMGRGGRLEISSAPGGNGVDIVFADDGPGLASPDSDLFFQPFYTTKPEGLGLGLSTSRKIVEQHGGTLVLVSREQGGVRAEIHLPLESDRQ